MAQYEDVSNWIARPATHDVYRTKAIIDGGEQITNIMVDRRSPSVGDEIRRLHFAGWPGSPEYVLEPGTHNRNYDKAFKDKQNAQLDEEFLESVVLGLVKLTESTERLFSLVKLKRGNV